jgi:hypothetical protein
MTETSPVSTQTAIGDPLEKQVATVGRVHPHVEIKIVDAEGKVVPRSTAGEFCTRGYSVMLGWEDEERSAQAIDRAGWMHVTIRRRPRAKDGHEPRPQHFLNFLPEPLGRLQSRAARGYGVPSFRRKPLTPSGPAFNSRSMSGYVTSSPAVRSPITRKMASFCVRFRK